MAFKGKKWLYVEKEQTTCCLIYTYVPNTKLKKKIKKLEDIYGLTIFLIELEELDTLTSLGSTPQGIFSFNVNDNPS